MGYPVSKFRLQFILQLLGNLKTVHACHVIVYIGKSKIALLQKTVMVTLDHLWARSHTFRAHRMCQQLKFSVKFVKYIEKSWEIFLPASDFRFMKLFHSLIAILYSIKAGIVLLYGYTDCNISNECVYRYENCAETYFKVSNSGYNKVFKPIVCRIFLNCGGTCFLKDPCIYFFCVPYISPYIYTLFLFCDWYILIIGIWILFIYIYF